MSENIEAAPSSARKVTSPVKSQPRIVFFATQLYALAVGRPSGFGGAETELWNVACGLAEASDYDVRALTLTDEATTPQHFERLELWPVPPAAKLTYTDSRLKRRRAIAGYFIGLFQRLRAQKAQIYFSKLASPEASTVWMASRAARGKFVFRVEHDWETNPQDLTNIIFRGSKFAARLFIYCLRRADLVIVQTAKQAEALKRNFGIDPVLIPNGHLMPPEDAMVSNPNQRRDIVWVARDHPMKRPMLFMELARRHPKVPFVMVMARSSEFKGLFEECQQAAASLPNVRFVPGLAPSELGPVYQAARVFVLTSEAEGFSNVIIEALKNGAPVLSLGHNPNSMLLENVPAEQAPAAPGYFTSDSLDITSAFIERLVSDDAFWMQCHKAARQYAVENFGLPHVLHLYRQHFDRLLADK